MKIAELIEYLRAIDRSEQMVVCTQYEVGGPEPLTDDYVTIEGDKILIHYEPQPKS